MMKYEDDWFLPPMCSLKQGTSLASIKCLLHSNKSAVRHYFIGNRTDQIVHAGIRIHCDALAHDLHFKYIVDSPYT